MLTISSSVPIRSELRDQYLGHRQLVRVLGNTSFADISSEIWVFDINSTLPDNGTTVIKPLDDVSPMPNAPGRYILFEKMAKPDYTKTNPVSGGTGNAVFYLTNDGTSTGTALFTTIEYVNAIVNDSTINYTYGWSYSLSTKALTVNVKSSTGLYIALLNLTLLGTPANVANGVQVSVLVKGT